MGFIAMAPEDGFRVGIPDPLHGRLIPANRFAETKYFLRHENISLPEKIIVTRHQTPEMQSPSLAAVISSICIPVYAKQKLPVPSHRGPASALLSRWLSGYAFL